MMGKEMHRIARKHALRVLLVEMVVSDGANGLADIDEVMDELATVIEQTQDAPFKVIRGGRET